MLLAESAMSAESKNDVRRNEDHRVSPPKPHPEIPLAMANLRHLATIESATLRETGSLLGLVSGDNVLKLHPQARRQFLDRHGSPGLRPTGDQRMLPTRRNQDRYP